MAAVTRGTDRSRERMDPHPGRKATPPARTQADAPPQVTGGRVTDPAVRAVGVPVAGVDGPAGEGDPVTRRGA
ncbi:hypothetical protein [Streptosporangium sp. NPDC000509]|uniref:hypothetical protein n=1 Tax=Streptosporangium sp. NPDC000509 TaxID=3366186 RepID=UPI0036A40A4B